jgi:hypothetical protein
MCELLLSGIGYVPTLNVHSDVWARVESYSIHMLLACRLKITFTLSLKLIISFLVYTTPSFITFSNSHFFSGQSPHASSSSIVLYLWLGAERLTTQVVGKNACFCPVFQWYATFADSIMVL